MSRELRDRPESWPVTRTEDLYRTDWVMALRQDTIRAPGQEETFDRLVLEHPGAVIVLAVDDRDLPKGLGATFTLSVMGSSVVYHLRYQIDRAAGFCTYTLDPERQHDIASVEGSYRLEPLPQGIRLIYQSRTDAGRAVPGFVKNWLASSSVKTQLEAMKKRAGG